MTVYSVLLPCGAWDQTQVSKLGSKLRYSLSHLAGPTVLSFYVGTVSMQMSGISRDPRTVPCGGWRLAAYRLSPHDSVGTLVTFPGSLNFNRVIDMSCPALPPL